MTQHGKRPNYVAIWIWLIGLTIFCVALSLVFGSSAPVMVLFFGVATVKALLVALNFMHLRYESGLIYAIAIVPVVFVLGLIVALFPDFVFSR
jgi:caa(3)-type oxidase subunit IV